jgi:hypothetical protein
MEGSSSPAGAGASRAEMPPDRRRTLVWAPGDTTVPRGLHCTRPMHIPRPPGNVVAAPHAPAQPRSPRFQSSRRNAPALAMATHTTTQPQSSLRRRPRSPSPVPTSSAQRFSAPASTSPHADIYKRRGAPPVLIRSGASTAPRPPVIIRASRQLHPHRAATTSTVQPPPMAPRLRCAPPSPPLH